LFSDNAKAQIVCAVQEILRMYAIKDFQCKPNHQHQKPAEHWIQEVKKLSNHMLGHTCVLFIVYLINHLSSESLGWRTPIEAALNNSLISWPCWYEPIYYKTYSSATFPSSSTECQGHVAGIAKHKSDAQTFLVLGNSV
jgi:hypothetical protein